MNLTQILQNNKYLPERDNYDFAIKDEKDNWCKKKNNFLMVLFSIFLFVIKKSTLWLLKLFASNVVLPDISIIFNFSSFEIGNIEFIQTESFVLKVKENCYDNYRSCKCNLIPTYVWNIILC